MAYPAWGGVSNGRIATSMLIEVPNFAPLPGHYAAKARGSAFMRADAARQLSGMMQAFYQEFGVKLQLSEGYRSYDSQGWYYNRYMNKLPGWTLAAFPGTSIHGWGLSADLNVNGANPSGKYLAWLRANAHIWGFVNDVASEVWHWSFRQDLVTQKVTIAVLISNPQSGNPAAGAMEEGGADVDRLIRNKKTGSVDWINVATGFHWHVPESGYIGAIENHIGSKVIELEDNWHGFYISRVNAAQNKLVEAVAKEVWSTRVKGTNGMHSTGARLAGADTKGAKLDSATRKQLIDEIVKALPSGGGTVVNQPAATVDTKALAKEVAALLKADIVKSIGDDLASRLKA